MPKFSRKFRPASDEEITSLEDRLGIRLLADYKEFLRGANGGKPTPNVFTVPDRGEAMVDILYGIGPSRSYFDLEFEQEQASQWDPLPPGFLAIGRDPGGSTLLLATAGKQAGRVFFWDRGGLWVREEGHNTFPVAASFSAFLDSLRELTGA